jgi:Uma2 family endonuclease
MTADTVLMTAESLHDPQFYGQRVELVAGRLLVHEPPGFEHGDILARVTYELIKFVEATPPTLGKVIAGDPGFVLHRSPDTVRAPDVAFVRRARLTGEVIRGFAEFAPDLAVEVRSPSDRRGELLAKVADWLRAGADLVWVIDPIRRNAQVFRSDESITLLGKHDALDGEAVLPGFALALETLFREG